MKAITGIKPTNILHIGNYFGALLPAVQMQATYDMHMMIADLHAITVPQKPEELRENLYFIVAAYLAAGIDPMKTILFQQSLVPAHVELAWLLQCVTKMGEAERMTQYKDKARAKGESVSVGLFTYPILMAADILLYQPEVVPVGFDQKQHVELTRDLAMRMNTQFGELFVVPKIVLQKEGAKIFGLDDPSVKMSKSAPSAKNYLSLVDSDDDLAKKIRSAVTDSLPTVTLAEDRPGVKNLLTILALCSNRTTQEMATLYKDSGMKALKEDTATAVVEYFAPVRERIFAYLQDKPALSRIVAEGSARARAETAPLLERVRSAMGLFIA